MHEGLVRLTSEEMLGDDGVLGEVVANPAVFLMEMVGKVFRQHAQVPSKG